MSSIKENLYITLDQIIKAKNEIKDGTYAKELTSFIYRMFPEKQTEIDLEAINKETYVFASAKAFNVPTQRSIAQAQPSETKVAETFSASEFPFQKKNRVVNHAAAGSPIVNKVETVTRVEPEAPGVQTWTNEELAKLVDLTPSELQAKLGDFASIKAFGKNELGLSFTAQKELTVLAMISKALAERFAVRAESTEEE